MKQICSSETRLVGDIKRVWGRRNTRKIFRAVKLADGLAQLPKY